jgi:hypothetical protein
MEDSVGAGGDDLLPTEELPQTMPKHFLEY